MEIANGRNSAFSHTIETTALPENVWRLWTDVSTWSEWDSGLKSASMENAFDAGATGKIVPLKGSIVPFTVIAATRNISSTFVTNLPLAQLSIERSHVALPDNSGTRFTHKVSFKGPLREI